VPANTYIPPPETHRFVRDDEAGPSDGRVPLPAERALPDYQPMDVVDPVFDPSLTSRGIDEFMAGLSDGEILDNDLPVKFRSDKHPNVYLRSHDKTGNLYLTIPGRSDLTYWQNPNSTASATGQVHLVSATILEFFYEIVLMVLHFESGGRITEINPDKTGKRREILDTKHVRASKVWQYLGLAQRKLVARWEADERREKTFWGSMGTALRHIFYKQSLPPWLQRTPGGRWYQGYDERAVRAYGWLRATGPIVSYVLPKNPTIQEIKRAKDKRKRDIKSAQKMYSQFVAWIAFWKQFQLLLRVLGMPDLDPKAVWSGKDPDNVKAIQLNSLDDLSVERVVRHLAGMGVGHFDFQALFQIPSFLEQLFVQVCGRGSGPTDMHVLQPIETVHLAQRKVDEQELAVLVEGETQRHLRVVEDHLAYTEGRMPEYLERLDAEIAELERVFAEATLERRRRYVEVARRIGKAKELGLEDDLEDEGNLSSEDHRE
jgi:hypothetical protein